MKIVLLGLILVGPVVAQQTLFSADPSRRPQGFLPSDPVYFQLAAADIDGDGDLDLAAIGGNQNGVNVLRNNAGAWSVSTPMGQTALSAVGWHDMDGDGDLDLVIGAGWYVDTPLAILRNDGAQFAWLGRRVMGPNGNVVRFAFGDVDGDGDEDLVVGLDRFDVASGPGPAPFLRLFRNDGAAGLTADPAGLVTTIPTGASPVLADLDGDGDLDLIAGSRSGAMALFYNVGGTLVDATASLPAGASASWVQAVDFDRDGDLDVLCMRPDHRIELLVRTPAGFVLQTGLAIAAQDAVGRFEVADADGDGYPDLFVPCSHGCDLLRNQGGTLVVEHFVQQAAPLLGWAVGDFDRDGRADVLLSWRDTVETTIHYGGRTRMYGDFALERTWSVPGTPLGAVGDLDGDLLPEILVQTGSTTGAMHNRGDGHFDLVSLNTGRVLQRARLVDFDGDGDLDLFGLGFQPSQPYAIPFFQIARNDGGLHFTSMQVQALGGTLPNVVIADLDGDGDQDLLAVAFEVGAINGNLHLFVNQGGMQFTDVGPLQAGGPVNWSGSFAVLDIDGDGDLDVVLGRNNNGCLEVLRNDGNLAFTRLSGCNLSMPGRGGLFGTVTLPASVDVDGDGDVDLFAFDFTGLYLQRNDGTGRFTAESIALPPGVTVEEYYVADFDGDGDPDLLLTSYANSRLLDNDGTGHFTDASARLGGIEYGGGVHVAVADLDGDGDIDLFPGVIACNNLRALVSTALPRLGGSLSLRVAGGPGIAPPGTVAIVALATAVSGQRRLPGIQGLLWLDLLQTTTVGMLVLPTPAGVAALGVPLPPLPALAGMRLFGQALIASPTSGFGFTPLLVEDIVP